MLTDKINLQNRNPDYCFKLKVRNKRVYQPDSATKLLGIKLNKQFWLRNSSADSNIMLIPVRTLGYYMSNVEWDKGTKFIPKEYHLNFISNYETIDYLLLNYRDKSDSISMVKKLFSRDVFYLGGMKVEHLPRLSDSYKFGNILYSQTLFFVNKAQINNMIDCTPNASQPFE